MVPRYLKCPAVVARSIVLKSPPGQAEQRHREPMTARKSPLEARVPVQHRSHGSSHTAKHYNRYSRTAHSVPRPFCAEKVEEINRLRFAEGSVCTPSCSTDSGIGARPRERKQKAIYPVLFNHAPSVCSRENAGNRERHRREARPPCAICPERKRHLPPPGDTSRRRTQDAASEAEQSRPQSRSTASSSFFPNRLGKPRYHCRYGFLPAAVMSWRGREQRRPHRRARHIPMRAR